MTGVRASQIKIRPILSCGEGAKNEKSLLSVRVKFCHVTYTLP